MTKGFNTQCKNLLFAYVGNDLLNQTELEKNNFPLRLRAIIGTYGFY